jgi:hypothetical protein
LQGFGFSLANIQSDYAQSNYGMVTFNEKVSGFYFAPGPYDPDISDPTNHHWLPNFWNRYDYSYDFSYQMYQQPGLDGGGGAGGTIGSGASLGFDTYTGGALNQSGSTQATGNNRYISRVRHTSDAQNNYTSREFMYYENVNGNEYFEYNFEETYTDPDTGREVTNAININSSNFAGRSNSNFSNNLLTAAALGTDVKNLALGAAESPRLLGTANAISRGTSTYFLVSRSIGAGLGLIGMAYSAANIFQDVSPPEGFTDDTWWDVADFGVGGVAVAVAFWGSPIGWWTAAGATVYFGSRAIYQYMYEEK